jgi:hypothetical protein
MASESRFAEAMFEVDRTVDVRIQSPCKQVRSYMSTCVER